MSKQEEKARLVGINHVALEVGSVDEALEFYGRIFDFELRGRNEWMAFVDMGDQFLALGKWGNAGVDTRRHFGLVVDDHEKVLRALEAAGVELLPGRFMDFLDPWGNRIQIVDYREIQFMKTPEVLEAMGLSDLKKTESAREELREKGLWGNVSETGAH